jgi:hypothetical protein
MIPFFSEESGRCAIHQAGSGSHVAQSGFCAAADEAMRDLPDPVDLDHVQDWGRQRGITRDDLISQMGGSP